MKKKYIKILSALLSILILFSSTGILIIHHTCLKCNINDWHLFTIVNCNHNIFKPDCCNTHNVSESLNNSNNLNLDKTCCSNSRHFFKIGLFSDAQNNTVLNNLDVKYLYEYHNLNIVISDIYYSINNFIGKSPPIKPINLFLLFGVLKT